MLYMYLKVRHIGTVVLFQYLHRLITHSVHKDPLKTSGVAHHDSAIRCCQFSHVMRTNRDVVHHLNPVSGLKHGRLKKFRKTLGIQKPERILCGRTRSRALSKTYINKKSPFGT